jgi:hypothetical protein
MRRLGQQVAFAVVSLSLMVSSTAAVASAPATTFQASASNAWLTLSMLTPSSAATLDGSLGVAAAQPETPPPPPPPPAFAGPGGTPPIPVLLIWLAVLGLDIYLIFKTHHEHRFPNSPA